MARIRTSKLPAPYLRHVQLDAGRVENWQAYPFSLPLFAGRTFEWTFKTPVT